MRACPAHQVGVVGMLQLVRRWPPHLFSAGPVVEAVQRRLVSQLNTPGPDTDALQEVRSRVCRETERFKLCSGLYAKKVATRNPNPTFVTSGVNWVVLLWEECLF